MGGGEGLLRRRTDELGLHGGLHGLADGGEHGVAERERVQLQLLLLRHAVTRRAQQDAPRPARPAPRVCVRIWRAFQGFWNLRGSFLLSAVCAALEGLLGLVPLAAQRACTDAERSSTCACT